ncbi:MAG: VWA domain-containing protein [Clostridia bacterium]|nr:VWA domain-containing protein [Clostridia bacterium]
MGVTNYNKELSVEQISCDEAFNVRLSLTATPDITSNPVDIVLILDRSGSMSGSAIANLKNGAKAFIDIIYGATGGTGGQIAGGTHIGIVSFADVATQDEGLITDVADLKAAVDGLTAGGSTNHFDAFTKSLALLQNSTANEQVMVMFTDGFTTTGGDPNPVATQAKAQGVIIYSIGLSGNGGIDQQALEDWASDPSSAYVVITPDDAELEQIFKDLAENISNPGATNVVITDTVLPCFTITALSSPTKGTATMVNSNTVEWKIDELGVNGSEGATFEFTVRHTGDCNGETEVNESVAYSDTEGNVVNFPSPTLVVECGTPIVEPCPEPVDETASGCTETIEFDAGEVEMQSLGSIVLVNFTIPRVCPNKRVAVAVILNEVDEEGNEHKRGFKTLTIPAHTQDSCRDVFVRCVKFVLPEDLDVATPTGMCNERNLRVRILANYIDNDFECCE